MAIKRNVNGLRSNAQKKRQEAFNKVEQGIQQLLKDKQAINFNTVAKAAGLSKAWLYKEPEIKARIEHLRENHSKTKVIPQKQRISDSSKDAIVKTLKERVKKIEAENRGLREQFEAIYGRVLYTSELEKRLEALEAENLKLKEELSICHNQLFKPSPNNNPNVVQFSVKQSKGEVSDAIENELDDLGIKLTKTLANKIKNSTEEAVLIAIQALKQQLQHQTIRSPGGWLASAIDNGWQPNQAIGEENVTDKFGQWYHLAREQGIVTASRKEDDGTILVRENTGQWVDFEEFSSKWTLEYLRSRM
ncbi:DUF6262 family protein [Calothrix rhizosoleniae]|uniref:DUF6262 family protein n=1 Tax=Calothrix rhizosoleniae TaxID=888997 RepID=UPI000B49FF05|nr:DUF6262 family protein [Calothrix rhizosoleniae]